MARCTFVDPQLNIQCAHEAGHSSEHNIPFTMGELKAQWGTVSTPLDAAPERDALMAESRAGCCVDWPKPCSYHEGWLDCLDSFEQVGWVYDSDRDDVTPQEFDALEPGWDERHGVDFDRAPVWVRRDTLEEGN